MLVRAPGKRKRIEKEKRGRKAKLAGVLEKSAVSDFGVVPKTFEDLKWMFNFLVCFISGSLTLSSSPFAGDLRLLSEDECVECFGGIPQ